MPEKFEPQYRWFRAMKDAIVALHNLSLLTPYMNMDVNSRPIAQVFTCIIKMAYLLVTSDSWSRRVLTPLEAAQLERHLKEDLLPLITQSTGEYIDRRRAEEFGTGAPTSEHPSR